MFINIKFEIEDAKKVGGVYINTYVTRHIFFAF